MDKVIDIKSYCFQLSVPVYIDVDRRDVKIVNDNVEINEDGVYITLFGVSLRLSELKETELKEEILRQLKAEILQTLVEIKSKREAINNVVKSWCHNESRKG